MKGLMRGAGRIFDISGSYSVGVRHKYNTQNSYAIDRDSLRKDWEATGGDLRRTLEQYEAEHGEER
jgi:hypothetical protein